MIFVRARAYRAPFAGVTVGMPKPPEQGEEP